MADIGTDKNTTVCEICQLRSLTLIVILGIEERPFASNLYAIYEGGS